MTIHCFLTDNVKAIEDQDVGLSELLGRHYLQQLPYVYFNIQCAFRGENAAEV